jgi:hypothetical protein
MRADPTPVLAERPSGSVSVGVAYILQVPSGRVVFRRHAWERMESRGVSVSDVLHVLNSGEQIEPYPDDTPFPSALMLARVSERPLHVVAARDTANDVTYVVTAYEPDPNEWDAECRRRRSP